jgi:hypothetical protein
MGKCDSHYEISPELMIIIFWEMTPCGISQKMIIIIVTAVETSNLSGIISKGGDFLQ